MKTPATLVPNTSAAGFTYDLVKNETSSGAGDGTPIEAGIINNLWYAMLAVLDAAGIHPSGTTESSDGTPVIGSGTNDLLDAINALIKGLLIDKDDMAPNSANFAPTQRSVKAFASGTLSAASNGYQKLPGGLILQWGVTGVGTTQRTETITFPVAFPTACLNATATMRNASANVSTSSGDTTAQIRSFSTTQVLIVINNPSSQACDNELAYWFAIGY